MMNGGEAADQMVSYAFKGGEVVLRLSGDAAKHLAIYLANLLKQGGPSKGRTTLKRMISDGSPLKVQRIRVDEIPRFNEMAKKYGVMFVAVKDKRQQGGVCDIMFRADDAARVNRICEKLAISDHKDVAHVESEFRREPHRDGNDPQAQEAAENPTRAARTVSPSVSSSPPKDTKGIDSIRAQLRNLRNDRSAGAGQPAAQVRAPAAAKPKSIGR